MGLADEVAVAAAALRPGPPCSFTKVVLDEDDAADLERLLADRFVPASAISRALIARGYAIKPQTVQRHRKRMCDCP